MGSAKEETEPSDLDTKREREGGGNVFRCSELYSKEKNQASSNNSQAVLGGGGQEKKFSSAPNRETSSLDGMGPVNLKRRRMGEGTSRVKGG